MNVLIVGSGAREHALAWKLRRSPRVDTLFTVPGNAGTASVSINLVGSSDDVGGLAGLAAEHRIDLTVVGPEVPLSRGVVDLFNKRGLAIFGPTEEAARLESSKAFAKELMGRHGIPCPDFKVFDSYQEAHSFLSKHEGAVVVKADGLAAGKGVYVCMEKEEAMSAVHACIEDRAFGASGDTVVIEEYLEGREVSVFGFTDGEHLSPLVAARDYKRLLDGDEGPNTGGMGSYSPIELWTPELEALIRDEIMVPVLRALQDDGVCYQGVLYAGLMITSQGPKVLEFNCRLGDPEAQVILPLLETDLVDVLLASIEGHVGDLSMRWRDAACVGVVMASGGYPGEYARGLRISGLVDVNENVEVFQAGTRFAGEGDRESIVTDGGRVLTVVGCGNDLDQARQRAYDGVRQINFQGAQYRTDVATGVTAITR